MAMIEKDELIGRVAKTKDLSRVSLATVGQAIAECKEIDPIHAAGGRYCRECEYYEVYTGGCEVASYGTCTRVKRHTGEDEFCSRGRRREDAE